MGWIASKPCFLKSKLIKTNILKSITADNTFGHVDSIDDYIWIKFKQPKDTDLWEDNKEYYIIVPFRKCVEVYDLILYKDDMRTLMLYGCNFNSLSGHMIDDIDLIKLYRLSFRR